MSRLQVDGWGVAQADLERSWESAELPDRCWLFRSPTTWTLMTMRRRVRYDDYDQPSAGTATITSRAFSALDEVAAEVERTCTSGAWTELLDAGLGWSPNGHRTHRWSRPRTKIETGVPPLTCTYVGYRLVEAPSQGGEVRHCRNLMANLPLRCRSWCSQEDDASLFPRWSLEFVRASATRAARLSNVVLVVLHYAREVRAETLAAKHSVSRPSRLLCWIDSLCSASISLVVSLSAREW
jgi:hypothetical protein